MASAQPAAPAFPAGEQGGPLPALLRDCLATMGGQFAYAEAWSRERISDVLLKLEPSEASMPAPESSEPATPGPPERDLSGVALNIDFSGSVSFAAPAADGRPAGDDAADARAAGPIAPGMPARRDAKSGEQEHDDGQQPRAASPAADGGAPHGLDRGGTPDGEQGGGAGEGIVQRNLDAIVASITEVSRTGSEAMRRGPFANMYQNKTAAAKTYRIQQWQFRSPGAEPWWPGRKFEDRPGTGAGQPILQ